MVKSKIDINQLREVVAASICWSDVIRSLGVGVSGHTRNKLKQMCEQEQISTEHFDVKAAFRRNKVTRTPAQVFCEHSAAHRSNVRPRAIKEGLYTGKCAKCNIDDQWNNKPLTLELDHINGCNTDNRRENLRWLCPNCHSQTGSYRKAKSLRKDVES